MPRVVVDAIVHRTIVPVRSLVVPDRALGAPVLLLADLRAIRDGEAAAQILIAGTAQRRGPREVE